MKKLLLIFTILLIGINGFSQSWENTNIILTNPSGYPYGVNIDNNHLGGWATEFSFSKNGSGKILSFGAYGSGDTLQYGYIGGNTPYNVAYNNTWMVFKPDGNVGIGTTSPDYKLEVNGTFHVTTGHSSKIDLGNWGHSFDFTDGISKRIRFSTWRSAQSGSDRAAISMYNEDGETRMVYINTSGVSYFNGGNVGIGTINPQSLLAVNGTITSTEVVVTTEGWSDFVFKKDYKLKDLEEIEDFIEENKHLPDIPSEKEVVENGVALGEMDAKLLLKIEELTLYMIDINKRVKALEEENKALKEENRDLKAQ